MRSSENFIKSEGRKSTNCDQDLTSFESDQNTSAIRILGHSSDAFLIKCAETSWDGRIDGWTEDPTG